jgi:hypothetical protein
MKCWITEGKETAPCPICKRVYLGVYSKTKFTIVGMEKPRLIGRMLKEIDWCNELCPECGSSMKTKWLFFSTGKCINDECYNYYKRGY